MHSDASWENPMLPKLTIDLNSSAASLVVHSRARLLGSENDYQIRLWCPKLCVPSSRGRSASTPPLPPLLCPSHQVSAICAAVLSPRALRRKTAMLDHQCRPKHWRSLHQDVIEWTKFKRTLCYFRGGPQYHYRNIRGGQLTPTGSSPQCSGRVCWPVRNL